MKSLEQPVWQKTQCANLIRYVPSGQYYARIRIRGKLLRKCLKTDLVSVAKLRLGDLEKVALSGPHRKWTSRHLSGRDRVKGAGA